MTGFLVKSKTTIPNILGYMNWIYLISSLHHGIAILPDKIERANTTCPPSWKCHALILCLKSSLLHYYVRNFCNLIGLEQWCFSLI